MDFENDIIIDESSLDLEWLEQPSLMLKYSKIAAKSRMTMDLAKEQLEIVKAELDKEIRKDPENFEISKITENVITNTITLQDEYQEAYQNYLNSKYEYDMALNATRAIEQRKDALENLVKLYGQKYFAGPKVPQNITEKRNKTKETNEKVSSKMKRKSK